MTGRVSFVGAGPGAADLITLRGARRIAEADIVVWAASLVDPECIREHARPDAELVDSSRVTHEDVLEIYRRAAASKLKVARVHSGDPALWGAVQEQYDGCERLGLDVEIVPGVSAFSAAAAVVGRELTIPEVAQSVILTRLEGGKTPMPDGEQIREFARHGTTMAIFLSAARTGQLAEELRAGGYAEDTPIVVAYKVTWPDELVLHTTLGELEATVKEHKLWRHTLFLVGQALRAGGTRSRLYHAGHFHTFRKADPAARRALRAETAGSRAEAPKAEEPEPEPRRAKPTRWSLRAGRAGRVAARVEAGRVEDAVAAQADATAAQDDAAAQPASAAAAWSAVHDWQETARNTPRGAKARAAKPVPAEEQPALHLVENPAAEPKPLNRPRTTVAAAATATRRASVNVSAPEPAEPARQDRPETLESPESAEQPAAATRPAAQRPTAQKSSAQKQTGQKQTVQKSAKSRAGSPSARARKRNG
ncbi:precorrin-4 C(11)-methyltransferase [Solihabitans fulvus]|uniref:Precorrin-4 C(11)-methyltransferase n=1 Tax=Solihabitans fulvus TaxID=1892852 RepID=A0A5B2X5Z5_9PSEU|nr:precorrin-4 C(11)-methyltransferase [Solihabitans fulvus]KAA2258561.1 precorrin-4 C(11)-methyltransferase [Solihabitans fulvus]